MDLSWVSILLLSFVWPTAFHIYEPATPLWLLFALVAAALSFADFTLRGKLERAAAGKNTLKYCTLIVLAQGAIFPFLYIFSARYHAEPFFAAIAGAVLNLFGLRAVFEGSTLYIGSLLKTTVFSSTWEKTGALYFILFAAGGAITLLLRGAKPRHFGVFFAATAVYAVARYAFLILLYATYAMHSIFWERAITFVTLLPYALMLAAIFKALPVAGICFKLNAVPKKDAFITGVLAFVLVFSGTSFFGFRDFGKEKQGRVLVDEFHSDWEWTTDIYDDQWFGERSGYNYYCFFNYLDKFYETRRNMDTIDTEALQGVDVFIMKTPTKPFETEEIAAMTEFVENGGGLYLIGDHTNVFGTGANLNELSEVFGLTFNYDCTYEIKHGSLSEYDAPRWMPHPIVADMPHFLFATSNTLGAKWQAEEVVVGYGLKALPADYSQMNFFPEDTGNPNAEFGLFLQSAGVQYGKGRVVGFTDSTVFSNFWMFMPGKPELLLGSIEWLNKENTLVGITPREVAAIILSASLLLNIVWGAKNRKSFPLPVFVLSGVATFLASSGAFHILGAQAVRLPEPAKPMTHITFEREYSRYKLPDDLDGFMSNMDEQLNTFYVWTQRLDYFPSAEEKLMDALQKGDLAVIAKPGRAIADPQKILAEIKKGANLLILDNMASGGFSNGLLKLAGMSLADADMATAAYYGEIKNIPLTANASVVAGGEAVMKDTGGNAVFSVTTIGDGQIAVFSDPDLLYSYELGDVSANLTDKTEILADMAFELLRTLLQG